MTSNGSHRVEMIPIDQICVLNPRARGKPKFQQIVRNIERLGLKKPIRVARRKSGNGEPAYDLVYGQGRLEAFRALGDTEIPAIVIEATREEALLMSLVENLSRRRYTSVDLVKQVHTLHERGYTYAQIARKTDLDQTYVRGLVRLIQKGEERLIQAVERRKIPISVAVTIASSDDEEVQRFLRESYENKTLRGKQLLTARNLIEKRKSGGKGIYHRPERSTSDEDKSRAIMRQYRQETRKQRALINKAKLCETRLLFVVSALRQLLQDEDLVTFLRAEGLNTLPAHLAEQMQAEGS